MKDSRLYAAVTVTEEEKYCAYVIPFRSSDNALSKFKDKGLLHANVYTSKKDAEEIAGFWNECYKKNGTYLYG